MNNEEDLAGLVEELREAVRARDAFLATAAHELRNPMHALLLQVAGALKAAQRRGDPELVERLERIQLVVDRYVRQATSLLDISRINNGRIQLQIEETDLAETVQSITKTYEAEAAYNGVAFNLETPPALPGWWDRMAMEQIVGNLVSNAVKYGAGAPVDLALRRLDNAAELVVTDRGIGISQADQERIFGRFEQVVNNFSRTGLGLGLWLVRSLVEAHGGEITVASAPGRGSVFTLRLPIQTTGAPSNE